MMARFKIKSLLNFFVFLFIVAILIFAYFKIYKKDKTPELTQNEPSFLTQEIAKNFKVENIQNAVELKNVLRGEGSGSDI